MENTVYCLAAAEPQASDILTHLRNLGFSAAEISVLLKGDDTRNISVTEDAAHGVKAGGIAGGILGALAGLTALAVPVVGPLLVAGPIVSALGGAAVGGVVGGLAGGTGALARIGIPEREAARLEQRLQDGAILIAVQSDDAARRDRALRVFKSAGAEDVYSGENLAA